MKILDIIERIDDTFDPNEGSFCKHFLESVQVKDPLVPRNTKKNLATLQTAAVAMKQVVSKQTASANYDLYLIFSDALCMFSDLVQLCSRHCIDAPICYIESLCQSYSLADFKQELLELRDILSPSFLAVQDELTSNYNDGKMLWMYTSFAGGDVRTCLGAIQPNRKGLKSTQVGYISDEANFKSILKRKPCQELFPVIMYDDCPACTDIFRSGQGCLTHTPEIKVPVVVLKR